jgi:DNA-binding CsgD family transcriptional regulator
MDIKHSLIIVLLLWTVSTEAQVYLSRALLQWSILFGMFESKESKNPGLVIEMEGDSLLAPETAETKYGVEKQETGSFGAKMSVLSLTFLLLLIVTVMVACYWHKKYVDQKKSIAVKEAGLLYEKDLLEKRIFATDLQITEKDKVLAKIDEITLLDDVKKMLKKQRLQNNKFKEQQKVFVETDTEFFRKLRDKAAPDTLTLLNLRYCVYLQMGMGSKDIMEILGISENTYWTNKRLLKQKLKLGKGESLENFLLGLSTPPPPEKSLIIRMLYAA